MSDSLNVMQALFWGAGMGALVALTLAAFAASMAAFYWDELTEWWARPGVDLDAADRQWVSEFEARAAHPAGRDLAPTPASGRVLCGSCLVNHAESQVSFRAGGITPVGGLLEEWECPTCGWVNTIRAVVRPVRGDIR